MKPLSKNAMKALEALRAGGYFESDAEYRNVLVGLCDVDGSIVDRFGRRGRAKEARSELRTAGYVIDEDMDGRNFVIGKPIREPEVTSC